MSKVRCSILVVVLATLGCANSIHVETDFDSSVDFDRFETYTFMPVVRRPERNQLLAARVRNAISESVEGRFRMVDEADSADLLIAWHRVLAERSRVTGTITTTQTRGWVGSYGQGYWSRYSAGGPRYGVSTTQTLVEPWTEGTLVIDIIDREKDVLIYRATSRTQISDNLSSDEWNRIIDQSIPRMLRDLPTGR